MWYEEADKFVDSRVYMKVAITGTVMRGGICRLFIVVLAGMLLFSGCAVKTAPAPEVTATPETTAAAAVTPTPEVTPSPSPTPALQNPVEEYWDKFEQAGDPIFSEMNLESDDGLNLDTLDKTLAVVQQMQHLQQLFLGVTELGQIGDNAADWSGLLVGGMEGTGSIQTTPEGYAFTCSYSDFSTLTGTLQGDVLHGEWQAEGRLPRSGEILLLRERYFALCLWEGTSSLMMLDGDTLWFAQGITAIPSETEYPEEWADWSCSNGLFTEYLSDTQPEEASA